MFPSFKILIPLLAFMAASTLAIPVLNDDGSVNGTTMSSSKFVVRVDDSLLPRGLIPRGEVRDSILNLHNQERALHGANPLTWDDSLAEYAYKWANGCVWGHSGGPQGENIAAGYSTAEESIESWYNECKQYDYSAGQFSDATGHFTQIVWLATERLGCSWLDRGDCPTGFQSYLVCEYYPAGNVIGEFVENVLPQQ